MHPRTISYLFRSKDGIKNNPIVIHGFLSTSIFVFFFEETTFRESTASLLIFLACNDKSKGHRVKLISRKPWTLTTLKENLLVTIFSLEGLWSTNLAWDLIANMLDIVIVCRKNKEARKEMKNLQCSMMLLIPRMTHFASTTSSQENVVA